MSPRRTTLLLAAVLALLAAPSRGHDLGRIEVAATFFRDGAYRIDLTVDAEKLGSAGLRGPAGETRYGPIDGLPPDVDRRLGGFLRRMADGAVVAFDGRPVRPELSLAASPVTSPGAPRLRFEGTIPAGARSFTWSQATDVGPYPLTLGHEGDAHPALHWLEGGAANEPFVLDAAVVPAGRVDTFVRYLRLGFTHILPRGLDHVLFVLGLFLLSRRLRSLLSQVTAFTVAHTASLALTLYGAFSVPGRIVEPLIALSIVVVAVENVATAEVRTSRVLLVFAFGLLHGMGFAGVLTTLGLPRGQLLPALVSFNAGVELGQLAVIALALAAVGAARHRPWYRRAVVVPASCTIGALGLYWSIARLLP